MKSPAEVDGNPRNREALYKGLVAAGYKMVKIRRDLITVGTRDKNDIWVGKKFGRIVTLYAGRTRRSQRSGLAVATEKSPESDTTAARYGNSAR